MGDPIGRSILKYASKKNNDNITVQCDICEDDTIPVDYFFRTFDQMPELEKIALKHAEGKVLDVGAAAGCHATYLKNNNHDVVALDISEGACDHLKDHGIETVCSDIMEFHEGSFDTILLLMNGIGLAKNLDRIAPFLNHLKSLLAPGGKILCDSSDISYLYRDEDGSVWMDLNSNYYGEIKYNMVYEDEETGWFDWLFIDRENLENAAVSCGFEFNVLFEGENDHYLAELKLI